MRFIACLTGVALLVIAGTGVAQTFHPEIPRTWDEKELEHFEVPLAQRDRSPRYMTADQYYALRVRSIYKSYPAYAPGQEPEGYLDSLRQKEPEIIFDTDKLRTREDWILAGKAVFESENSFSPAPPGGPSGVYLSLPTSKVGVLPFFLPGFSYIVRKKGVLEIGSNSCAGCHTRVMGNGSFVEGAQGMLDVPWPPDMLQALRDSPDRLRRMGDAQSIVFGTPWLMTKEQFQASLTPDQILQRLAARHPGVFARQGTSSSHPPHVPSLIGIADIKYLDATGLVRHRSIGDLMRYAVINEGLDTLAHFGDFQPSPRATPFSAEEGTRFSDEQLYALALYIYSLKPPPNPNPFDDRARRGQRIFQQQGCIGCHTPPLYTSNKLTPALNFEVPEDLRKSDDILNLSVGTDPTLATRTRRGTGFYKVPSLRGVWFRNAFGHGGQAETLEEWLNPERLTEDYVPKGFHLGSGPIKGHNFGMNLDSDSRDCLIAFLKTL